MNQVAFRVCLQFNARHETEDDARQIGVTYKTAYLMFKRGELDAYQLPTGTLIVNEPTAPAIGQGVTRYARVSSHDQKTDAQRQQERLRAAP